MADRISVDELKELVAADFETGQVWWRQKPREDFQSEKAWLAWNEANAGKEAFNTKNNNGVHRGMYRRAYYMRPHIVYALFFDEWPDGLVGHADGNSSNDAIKNLHTPRDGLLF